jgi:hypothetical protein
MPARNEIRPRRTAEPAVERLDDRQLLSVVLSPSVLSTRALNRGAGRIRVTIFGETPAGQLLVQAAENPNIGVGLLVSQSNGDVREPDSPDPRSVRAGVVLAANGTFVQTASFSISRASLRRLAPGTAVVSVLDRGNILVSESATLGIFVPLRRTAVGTHRGTH